MVCLLNYRNVDSVIKNLQEQVEKAKMHPRRFEIIKTDLIETNKASYDNIGTVISALDGEIKDKASIIKELEMILEPKTVKEKNLIIKEYDIWRNNYMKYGA